MTLCPMTTKSVLDFIMLDEDEFVSRQEVSSCLRINDDDMITFSTAN